MAEILATREVVIARELTKIHEEFKSGSPAALLEYFSKQPVKGEIVILLVPNTETDTTKEYDLEAHLRHYLFIDGLSVKDAAARVSAESGRPRREVYAISLAVKAATKLSEK
jgi:16S rRNA (cytidine1402-2'-O)-methyltransferase